jgi:hypothetical protein
VTQGEEVRQLAGYLSTYTWYEDRHPGELLELAEHCLSGIDNIKYEPVVCTNITRKYKFYRCIYGGVNWVPFVYWKKNYKEIGWLLWLFSITTLDE